MGSEINIFSDSRSLDREAEVALKPGGGGFVVTFNSVSFDPELPIISDKVAEVSAFDTVTILISAGGNADAVSFDSFGDYLLTFAVSTGGTSVADIYGQRGYLPF